MGFVNEWWKRLNVLIIDSQIHNDHDMPNGSVYHDLIEHQKEKWTPSELYGKCCPVFLAGMASRRNKNGQLICGGCNKIHPTITLYFDVDKNCTVAVLSCCLDPFKKFFDQCVKEGNAVWISPLYCELNGYLRENLYRLQHQQRYFGRHLVDIAMGALNDSDVAQRSQLEEAHIHQYQRRHHRYDFQRGASLNTVSISSPSVKTSAKGSQDIERLEIVLEICGMWGLGDCLDVLSIYCLIRTSMVFRKLGIGMAKNRVKECNLVITPLVDGHVTSGNSLFRRVNTNLQTILQREEGHFVEYAMCSSILYRQQGDKRESSTTEKKNEKSLCGSFCPVTYSNDFSDQNPQSNKYYDESSNSTDFSWACEELSYANLEVQCMKSGLQEYIGQQVIVQWRCDDVDNPTNHVTKDASTKSASASFFQPTKSGLPALRVKIDRARQNSGIAKFSVPHFHLRIDIRKSLVAQVDEVTSFYEGEAKILECRTGFLFLVAVYARSLLPRLVEKYQQIKEMRPLLQHEHTFLEEVQQAASICSLPSAPSNI